MSNWIKMRCNLWTHPKVVTLSSQLSVTRVTAIGALHGAWSIADQHADENGRIEMSADALDLLIETPGFCTALRKIGWLIIGEDALQFTDYQEHNGTTGKSRADAQKRQRASRIRHNSVTEVCDKTVTRVEKRREDTIAPKAARERNPLFDALAEATGQNAEQITKSAGGQIGKALAEIKAVSPEITAEQIKERAANYRTHFKDDIAISPSALAKWWGLCDKPKGGNFRQHEPELKYV
jgi:hypothetical protein